MRRIVVRKAEDCPFSAFYDTMWCTYPRVDDFDKDPICILYSQPSPPCPLIGGLQLELEDDDVAKGTNRGEDSA